MLRLGKLWGVAVVVNKRTFEPKSTFELKGMPLACVGARVNNERGPPPIGHEYVAQIPEFFPRPFFSMAHNSSIHRQHIAIPLDSLGPSL